MCQFAISQVSFEFSLIVFFIRFADVQLQKGSVSALVHLFRKELCVLLFGQGQLKDQICNVFFYHLNCNFDT